MKAKGIQPFSMKPRSIITLKTKPHLRNTLLVYDILNIDNGIYVLNFDKHLNIKPGGERGGERQRNSAIQNAHYRNP